MSAESIFTMLLRNFILSPKRDSSKRSLFAYSKTRGNDTTRGGNRNDHEAMQDAALGVGLNNNSSFL